MRVLGCLVLVGLLTPALPTYAELSEADGLISLSVPAVGWVVRFLAQGYTLSLQRDRQDGKGHYYMFTNATTGRPVEAGPDSPRPPATGTPGPPGTPGAAPGTGEGVSRSPRPE